MAQLANRILVADDDLEILEEVTSYLQRRGQVVISTASFDEALIAYRHNMASISLVITDVRMPDGDGMDLVRFVIDWSQGACPCLLMSGNFDRDGLSSDLTLPGVGRIEKPFGLSQLYASVLGALATAGRAESYA